MHLTILVVFRSIILHQCNKSNFCTVVVTSICKKKCTNRDRYIGRILELPCRYSSGQINVEMLGFEFLYNKKTTRDVADLYRLVVNIESTRSCDYVSF